MYRDWLAGDLCKLIGVSQTPHHTISLVVDAGQMEPMLLKLQKERLLRGWKGLLSLLSKLACTTLAISGCFSDLQQHDRSPEVLLNNGLEKEMFQRMRSFGG